MDTGNYTHPRPETSCEAKTITECESESLQPTGHSGPLIARIPVVVAESVVHIHIESKVQLNEYIAGIRNCIRDVHITQCKLLDLGSKNTGKIFFNGYIRENVEYAALNHILDGSATGDIRYKVIKVPFECVAKINYCTPPVIRAANRFITVGLSASPKTPSDLWQSLSVQDNSSLEQRLGYGPARIFCELDEVRIMDAGWQQETDLPEMNDLHFPVFDTLCEFILLSITFTLLQWQPVSIPRTPSKPV